MIVYKHEDCLKKFNGNGHPERKERLDKEMGNILKRRFLIQDQEIAEIIPLSVWIILFSVPKQQQDYHHE